MVAAKWANLERGRPEKWANSPLFGQPPTPSITVAAAAAHLGAPSRRRGTIASAAPRHRPRPFPCYLSAGLDGKGGDVAPGWLKSGLRRGGHIARLFRHHPRRPGGRQLPERSRNIWARYWACYGSVLPRFHHFRARRKPQYSANLLAKTVFGS